MSGIYFAERIRIWGGTASADLSQFRGGSVELPPDDLLKGTLKPLLDVSKWLQPIKSREKKLKRDLWVHGTRTDNGVFIRAENLDTVLALFDEAKRDMEVLKQNLLSNLDAAYAEWEKEHPKWVGFLRQRRRSAKEVDALITFDRDLTPFGAQGGEVDPRVAESLESQRARLVPEVLAEVAQRAKEMIQKSFYVAAKGKKVRVLRESVGQRAIGGLREIEEKLADFALFDPTIQPVRQMVRRALNALPAKGDLNPGEVAGVVTLLSFLSEPTVILDAAAANQAIVVENTEDLFANGEEASGVDTDEPTPVSSVRATTPEAVAASMFD